MIVVTGGRVPGDRFTEAGVSADYLHKHAVPDTAILRETTGRTSWESLEAAAQFLEEGDMRRVVLVSDPYHSARIKAIAHEVGLDAVTSPTRTSPIKGMSAFKRLLGETVARRRRKVVRLRTSRPSSIGRKARSGTGYTLTPPR